LTSFEITSQKINSAALIEPSKHFNVSVEVRDANDLSDITDVKIELGGDNQLGLLYKPQSGSCSSLDGRLLVTQLDCSVDI